MISGLQNGERQCHPVCVQGVLLNKDLEDEENVLVPGGEMKTLDDFPLEEFVFSTLLPSIRLTKDLAEKKRKELQKQQVKLSNLKSIWMLWHPLLTVTGGRAYYDPTFNAQCRTFYQAFL